MNDVSKAASALAKIRWAKTTKEERQKVNQALNKARAAKRKEREEAEKGTLQSD